LVSRTATMASAQAIQALCQPTATQKDNNL
jgi:hypothetical protein